MGRLKLFGLVLSLALICAACGPADWAAYLDGPMHASDGVNATTITTANAASLHSAWTWTPVAKTGYPTYLYSSPITVAGVTYIGAATGDFYAVDDSTGATIWRKQLTVSTCSNYAGLVSSATVAPDPVTKKNVVYVGGADHYLYALDPATGNTIWRSIVGGTNSDYYNWSSPTVANGHIYMGVSVTCDVPYTNGAEEFDQHTGALLNRWYIAGPTGDGASVYTSAAIASDGSVFVTTGDENGGSTQDAESIVHLSADLKRIAGWQIPGVTGLNLDFNASPTIWSANSTPMVGACDKNGVFYAFKQSDFSGPAWTDQLGVDATPNKIIFCGGSAAYDGTWLYVGANERPNTTMPGSIYELDPATGKVQWYTGLDNGPVIGSPSLDGSGVLAVPTYNQTNSTGAVYLVDKSNGKILLKLSFGGPIFAQPVFEGGQLLVAGPHLQAFTP